MTRHLSEGWTPARVRLFGRYGRLFVLACTALAYPAVHPAFAQDAAVESPPAHISFVEGNVILERDGQIDNSPASMPLLAGDRVRTQGGRVEILFADGSALHLDQQSVVDFQSDEVVRLLDGRMRLNIAGQGRDVSYRIDAPAAWVEIGETGEYRVAVLRGDREPQVELAVLRGAAELVNEDGRSLVRAGERAFVRAGAQPSPPYVFNSAMWDAFDRWSEARRDHRLGVSAQYLPADVRPYSTTLDNYGAWRYEQEYGYVWYPRVAVGWRPYYHGRWVGLRPYGWTWIAADPWGWPTHHYGRWGYSGASWFWIPGRRWGAAWVSWAYAPNYVSWCPLGWNDRPLFSFVNINLNYHRGRYYDPWHAWTVLPRRHFGVGFVNTNVIAGRRLDGHIRGSFVVRDRAPDWHYSGHRASAPIRSAGRTGYAVPRGTGNSVFSSSVDRNQYPSGSRNFPSPSRDPRIPQADRNASRSGSPVTAAPQRAVPRDRGVRPDNFNSTASRGEGLGSPGIRRSPDARSNDDGRRVDQSSTRPPAGTRAVPRGTPDNSPERSTNSGWRTYDRSGGQSAPQSIPDSPRDSPDAGYRRSPGSAGSSDGGGGVDRYRAVPRQDAPRPSYDAPRPSPRSYGAPSQESRPPSYGGAPERRGAPSGGASADRPSHGESPSNSGGSRSRGDRPSQGQATRRGRG
jgi:hypothetical protein